MAKKMNLSPTRMAEILNAFSKKIAEQIHASKMIEAFGGQLSWEECVEDPHEKDELMVEFFQSMEDAEIDKVMRPHLADAIAEQIGAEKVIIQW